MKIYPSQRFAAPAFFLSFLFLFSACPLLSAADSVKLGGKGRLKENPPKRFIENIPPAKKLPRAKDRGRTIHPLSVGPRVVGPTWTALGPFPIPNGQTEGGRQDPVSGRVTAIAVHPVNSSIVYVGTAQGGLYRTLDAGGSWTQLMDGVSAGAIGTPLAIGSVAIDPTNPANVIVGTGEGNNSGDSFFGNGLYIVTQAESSSPVIHGPYNLRASDSADIFTGRSIVGIAIDPANHNNAFLTTGSGVGGLFATAYSTLPPRGLYRTTNLFAGVDGTGTPVFSRLDVAPSETNAIMTSVVMDPANGNNLVCALFSQNGTSTGGIYRSTNALAPTPTFTRTKARRFYQRQAGSCEHQRSGHGVCGDR